MDDVVHVTILESAANLPGKLSCDAFAETTVADDEIEHLPAVDVFEHHVVVVLMDDHLAHAADVGVVEEEGEGGLAQGADLLRGILGCLFCEAVWDDAVDVGYGSGIDARKDLDSELRTRSL